MIFANLNNEQKLSVLNQVMKLLTEIRQLNERIRQLPYTK